MSVDSWQERLWRWPMKPSWDAILLGVGFLSLAVPTIWRLAHWVWPSDDQGHGPLVLAVSLLLGGRRWAAARAASSNALGHSREWATDRLMAMALMAISIPLYFVGRSQAILMAEVGSLIALLWSLLLMHLGRSGVRVLVFPLAFLLFMIPLPEALVAAVTAPMKSAVSTVAAWLLQGLGQPVARSGVMLTAGPYQLLVADACAGLTTLFTLEALGLLYLHLRGHAALWRNLAMAVLVVPISFAANVLRVMTLVMVTLYWGDAAGQGFAHDFAGITLFTAALLLLLGTDSALGFLHAMGKCWVAKGAGNTPHAKAP